MRSSGVNILSEAGDRCLYESPVRSPRSIETGGSSPHNKDRRGPGEEK